MSMPKCIVCKASVMEKDLHRANPKGEAAIWKCEDCLDRLISDDMRELLDTISKNRPHKLNPGKLH